MTNPALSYDRAAREYEDGRPSYPAELLDDLPLPATATVLDLGAGTGKLTRVLAARYAHVIAVEPLDGMRAVLERLVPGADARAGTAEAIPLPDGSVDAVFAAQAFHWFATDEALAEIARVLRPGGVFAILWNEEAEPSPLPQAFRDRVAALLAEVGDLSPAHVLHVVGEPFGELRGSSIEHPHVQSRASRLAFMQSLSSVARRPVAEREALVAELAALLPDGEYTFTMRASIRWAPRS